ncbi:hypothetical protein LWC08_06725 [Desulfobaculum bizertense]|uniref:hypothetical protein n=1 Tax=Desulfobaculum bizertense TaxID=376490 RepID=UPI001F2E8384|nr:hypothetical protein [Desulfobaculum bizertense]UIJ39259.1 hypothetical protein LWC08_06725 [Desulfobaculum bizertense]
MNKDGQQWPSFFAQGILRDCRGERLYKALFYIDIFWHEGCSLQYEKSHRLHDRRDAPGKLTAQGKAGEYNEDWNDDHPLGG